VLDRAVLAGRVHRLKDDQDRVTVVGVEQRLGLGQVGEVLVQDRPGALLDLLLAQFLHLARLGPPRVPVLEPEALPRRDAEEVEDVFANHVKPPEGGGPKGRSRGAHSQAGGCWGGAGNWRTARARVTTDHPRISSSRPINRPIAQTLSSGQRRQTAT